MQRAGVPAPPDSPDNVPGAPAPSPGPEEPLEPGFPQPPPDEDDDEDRAAAGLAGRWRVERVSGLLPPAGLRKRIGAAGGSTRLGPLPLALFRVRGRTLDYRLVPVRDELVPSGDGEWQGRGLLFGREFCRFRLVRETR